MLSFFANFIALFVESAPWLVLGFIVAGLIKTLIPKEFMSKHLGGKGLWTTIKAAFIGAPLPLCSCGVVPAALGLRRNGASKNATVSFLVATPETGVDSIAVTYALMGPIMAIVRPIAAISSGILAGVLVGKSQSINSNKESRGHGCCAKAQSSCCSSTQQPAKAKEGCCSSAKQSNKATPPSLLRKLALGVQFSFDDMLKDISLWLVIGLVFAAAVQTWVPASFLTQWGSGVLAFVLMAVVGIPMYICATASTPIAAGLLMAGVSPGAVLVFMLVGPATNLGTLAIVGKELGHKALAAYLAAVVIVSFVAGYLLNLFAVQQNWNIAAQVHAHAEHVGWLSYFCAVLLAAAIIRIAIIRCLPKANKQQNRCLT